MSELLKILKLENFTTIINNEELLKIFLLVFPEFRNINRLRNFENLSNKIKNSEILLLSILLVDLKNNHEYFSHKYKVSNKISDNLVFLGKKFKEMKTDREFFKKKLNYNLYNIGKSNLKILYCLNLLDKIKISSKDLDFFRSLEKISIPNFPFDGKTLLKKGIQQGKKIGIILKEAEKTWVQNDFKLSSEDFETIIKKNNSST